MLFYPFLPSFHMHPLFIVENMSTKIWRDKKYSLNHKMIIHVQPFACMQRFEILLLLLQLSSTSSSSSFFVWRERKRKEISMIYFSHFEIMTMHSHKHIYDLLNFRWIGMTHFIIVVHSSMSAFLFLFLFSSIDVQKIHSMENVFFFIRVERKRTCWDWFWDELFFRPWN